MKILKTGLHGFLMALADSVPGISGDTVAFRLDFYDSFIGSINKVIYGSEKEKKEGLIYLLKLFAGWIVGILVWSLNAIAVGSVSVSKMNVMLNWKNFSFLFFVAGMTIVAGMEMLKRKAE